MRIDLHVHSTASDGTLSPAAVVAEARAHGVGILALTDHDTMGGVAEALAAGEAEGVRVIPGVELNTDSPAGEVHVLGYCIPPEDEAFTALLERRSRARIERAHKMVQRLHELGMPIAFDHVLRLAGGGNIGRPHVARALVEAGYARNVREAFDRWLYRGGPAYVPRDRLTPEEAIAAVKAAGGVPVLAHPGRIADQSVIEELIAAGLEGLECFYPEHSPEQTERYLALARKHGLLVTGGTDFHGPGSTHDTVIGSVSAPAEGAAELLRRWRERKVPR